MGSLNSTNVTGDIFLSGTACYIKTGHTFFALH